MNKAPNVVTVSLAGIDHNAAKLLFRTHKRMWDAGWTTEEVAEFNRLAGADVVLATATRDDRLGRNYKRVLAAAKACCEIDN